MRYPDIVDTALLLAEIERPKSTRRDVAALYAVALRLDFGQTDWPVVNRAIIRRNDDGSAKQGALFPDDALQISLMRPRPAGACIVQGCGANTTGAVETRDAKTRVLVCETHALSLEAMGWRRTVPRYD